MPGHPNPKIGTSMRPFDLGRPAPLAQQSLTRRVHTLPPLRGLSNKPLAGFERSLGPFERRSCNLSVTRVHGTRFLEEIIAMVFSRNLRCRATRQSFTPRRTSSDLFPLTRKERFKALQLFSEV